jgi:hypothetical protein
VVKLKGLRTPIVVFLALCALTAAIGALQYRWAGWRPATCWPAACFCEAIRDGVFRQPANTWSSLGFVLAGLLGAGRGLADNRPAAPLRNRNLSTSTAGYPLLLGGALISIGLGSAFYHASLSFLGQLVDVSGMNLLATYLIAYALARTSGSGRGAIVLYVMLNLLLALAVAAIPGLRRSIFALLLAIGLVLELRYVRAGKIRIDLAWLKLALAVMALAYAIWLLDLTRVACAPTSWLQGHAIWHGLGAISALLLYRYYRSENLAERGGAAAPNRL